MTLGCSVWTADRGERLEDALRRRGRLPFTRGYRLPLEGGVRWARGVLETAELAFVVEEDEQILGGLALSRARWESELYGVAMARVPLVFTADLADLAGARRVAALLLERAEAALDEWGIDHVSALVMAEDTGIVHAFNDARWRLVDSTLELTWACGHTTPAGADETVLLREALPGDREPLRELARAAYTHHIRTRFSCDPWLPLERTGDLYARWFELACDGEFGDVVVVAEVEGRPVGFNTFKLDPVVSEATGVGFATHGIAAVEPDFRGRAGQPAMLHWLAEWQRARGGRFNRGRVLINNQPMQRACLKSGGFISQAYQTFHRWRAAGRAPTGEGPA